LRANVIMTQTHAISNVRTKNPAQPPVAVRRQVRQLRLDRVFEVDAMRAVWKNTVRNGLRRQDVLDLHDYHDFHRSLDTILEALRTEVCTASYRPKRSQQVRIEKAAGICRRIHIPAPEDAVLFQTMVDSIAVELLQKQPAHNAFYSRSHPRYRNPNDVDHTFPYDWWELWPEFQRRIFQFTSSCDFIAVTDISNYFDCISLRQLRNTIASLVVFDEPLLDFLFFMLEEFVWRPDYLPSSGVGLPQLNFDAPRLLAHVFLFESDTLLSELVGQLTWECRV
jgi:hypothetical protein